MKTLLICPDHRIASAAFHRVKPLALMPVLGRLLIEHHLVALAAKGVKEVIVLASDQPELIRAAVADGAAWGLSIEVAPTRCELAAADAKVLYFRTGCTDAIVVDHLPDDYFIFWKAADKTFSKLIGLIANPKTAESMTMREVSPQVWVSTKARISDDVVINGPAWIGPCATVGKGAVVGPRVIIESDAFVDEYVTLSDSWVGPSTYIGPAMNVSESFVWGHTITNWRDGSVLDVQDDFVLNNLEAKKHANQRIGVFERLLALLLMIVLSPAALVSMIGPWIRRTEVFTSRRVVVSRPAHFGVPSKTQALKRLPSRNVLIRRWPELWHVVRGEMALVGNRPLMVKDVAALRGEMWRLWLDCPAGVFSLADSEGDDPEKMPTALAHAAYFTTHKSLRLKARILWTCLIQTIRPSSCIFFNPTHEH